MKVFVAGASGGSGKLVVQQLAAKGISVRAGVRVSFMRNTRPAKACVEYWPSLHIKSEYASVKKAKPSVNDVRNTSNAPQAVQRFADIESLLQNVEKAKAAEWSQKGSIEIVPADLTGSSE